MITSWLSLAMFGRKLLLGARSFVVGLIGLSIAVCIFSIHDIRDGVDAIKPLETILTQLGATYGTILALVLTLSIIPIQRASEVWSPAITILYRRDLLTYVTFVLLGAFCVVSFALSVSRLSGTSVSTVLAASIVILGLNLDLLRWYHGHICQLLDPTYAVNLALKHAKKVIRSIDSTVTRVAGLQHRKLSQEQQRRFTITDTEAAIYPALPGYPNSINFWIRDLGEMAIKAVARGEKRLASVAVFAISQLVIEYLSSRKRNLTISAAPEAMFLVSTSDVSVVTERAYESLQEVSRTAVNQNDESTAIRVSEAYKAIATHTARLGANAFREGTAPLTFSPIYWALQGVKYAQSKGLEDVSFQSAAILARIPGEGGVDITPTDVVNPVIDGLVDISSYLYGKRSWALAEEVIGHSVTVLMQLLVRGDYYFDDTLRYVLGKIGGLAPLAMVNEVMADRFTMVRPLGNVYGLTNPTSLGYIIDRAAEILPKVDPDREWVNPYSELADILDIVGDHLRKLGRANEFGESWLIWEIDALIKHAALALSRILKTPLRNDFDDGEELLIIA